MFKLGDWVYLKLRSYRKMSVAKSRNEKLVQRYFGPYQIIAKYGSVAYKLELPPHSSVHPVFHVSQLMAAILTAQKSQDLPAILSPTLEWVTEPELLLDARVSESGQTEVLVKWNGLPSFESTWELLTDLVGGLPG